MNIIFISPNYPAGHRRYVAALRAAGHTVLGIGDAGDETFAPDLRGALSAYYRVGDLHDYDQVYRACRYYEWQFGRVERIESLNPYWRDLVAALSREVCAQPAQVEQEYRALADIGIGASALTPRVLASTPKKPLALAGEYGYPLYAVAAGNKRLGSTFVVADAGVKSLLRGSTKDEYVFAVCPDGEKLSVDGLMLGGEVVACGAHLRAEDGQSVSAVAVDGLAERCALAAAECGLADGFFHISAVKLAAAVSGVGKKGEVCFVSFEPVPPHEYIIDLLDMEFGCDLRRSWAEGRAVLLTEAPCAGWSERTDGSADPLPDGEDQEPAAVALPLERVSLAALAMRSFERSYKNLHEKVLHRLALKLTAHGRTEEPDRWDYSDYVYLFTGENAAELKRGIKFITEDHPVPAEKPAQEPAADTVPAAPRRRKAKSDK
ncbi:MAG: hypothetical protein E7554_01380 [Ruminococcaceae bacterium]|nr:hypothetical protein [Oscillospiraceae bacterium]